MNKMVDMQKAFDAVYKYFHLGNAMECERLYKALEEAYELTAQPETCEYWDNESNYCVLYRPSAQSEQQWVSVMERLPKD